MADQETINDLKYLSQWPGGISPADTTVDRNPLPKQARCCTSIILIKSGKALLEQEKYTRTVPTSTRLMHHICKLVRIYWIRERIIHCPDFLSQPHD